MTNQEQAIVDWIEQTLIDEQNNCAKSTLGMIKCDIDEFGFQGWLRMTPERVIKSYIETVRAVSDDLVDEFSFLQDQEDLLEYLEIRKNDKLCEPKEAMRGFQKGMIDVWNSLLKYFEMKSEAEHQYYLEE
jgi:hypothetical protein